MPPRPSHTPAHQRRCLRPLRGGVDSARVSRKGWRPRARPHAGLAGSRRRSRRSAQRMAPAPRPRAGAAKRYYAPLIASLRRRITPPLALLPRPSRAPGSEVRGPASNRHHRRARLARRAPAGRALWRCSIKSPPRAGRGRLRPTAALLRSRSEVRGPWPPGRARRPAGPSVGRSAPTGHVADRASPAALRALAARPAAAPPTTRFVSIAKSRDPPKTQPFSAPPRFGKTHSPAENARRKPIRFSIRFNGRAGPRRLLVHRPVPYNNNVTSTKKAPRPADPDARTARAEAALLTARTSSAVEGIRKPFEGTKAREAAYGHYAPATFPSARRRR